MKLKVDTILDMIYKIKEMLISPGSRGSSLTPSVKCEPSYNWDDNAKLKRKQYILDRHFINIFLS